MTSQDLVIDFPWNQYYTNDMEGKTQETISGESFIEIEKFRLTYLFEHGIDFTNRTLQLTGTIGHDFDFSYVDCALSEFERMGKKKITIRLNSEGGSVTEALAIVGRIRASSCKITIEGYGLIASAATMILAAGHNRKISKYASFMHHESAYSVSGKHTEVTDQVIQMEKEEKLWAQWMAELSKKDYKFWYNKGKRKDYFITAEQAVEFGVADEVIS